MSKIIAISGSIRNGSLNAQLAKYAVTLAQDAGADAEYLDLADYEMPIYNGDLEERDGKPEAATRLKKKFIEADGMIIASPEYNSSITPLLKNSLDWISRPDDDDDGHLPAFNNKTALLLAASPGGFGGMRGLVPLRMMLGNIAMHVYHEQVAIPAAHEKISDEKVSDEALAKRIKGTVQGFVEFTDKV